MMALLELKTEMTVIYVTDNIASYNIVRLITNKVNFIILQKQMFIPALLLDLKKTKSAGADLKEKMAPFVQSLLLYHIQVKSLDRSTSSDLMQRFDVPYATANCLMVSGTCWADNAL